MLEIQFNSMFTHPIFFFRGIKKTTPFVVFIKLLNNVGLMPGLDKIRRQSQNMLINYPPKYTVLFQFDMIRLIKNLHYKDQRKTGVLNGESGSGKKRCVYD